MTDYAKKIKEKLDIVTLEREDFNTLVKDRLDFGFDSIYFRYAELCDELAMYKVMYEHELPCNAKKAMNGRKMHFYNCLEQFVMRPEIAEYKQLLLNEGADAALMTGSGSVVYGMFFSYEKALQAKERCSALGLRPCLTTPTSSIF